VRFSGFNKTLGFVNFKGISWAGGLTKQVYKNTQIMDKKNEQYQRVFYEE